MRKLKLNFSTCPNDTFMFDALVNGKIDCRGLEFEVTLSDIEELNKAALTGEADITKMSYALYPEIAERYNMLKSGSALGYGSGPLFVSKRSLDKSNLSDIKVALPGEHTTAARLLDKLFPEVTVKSYCLFSDISRAILEGSVDAGVLIHEERFTYQDKGLRLVADLGDEWEKLYSLPIPLGGIVIKKDIPTEVQQLFEELLSESVRYAFENPKSSREYVKRYARELSDEIIDKHIDMFVNDFSVNIGDLGVKSIEKLIGGVDFV